MRTKTKELRQLNTAELEAKIREKQERLFRIKFSRRGGGEFKNPLEIRYLRHDIARILTVLKERKEGK